MTRISERSAYWPRLSIGLKRYLLRLNRDIDKIIDKINYCRDFGFYFNHSIYPSQLDLTNYENAVLFLEDRRFFLHRGFEFRSIARTLKRFIKRQKLGGISTIDQQVVRIATRRYERTLYRKFGEIIRAVLINFRCSKKEILHYYIFNTYMGYKLNGCEEASNFLFRTPASSLNQSKAAFLASLLPLPLPKSVYLHIRELDGGGIARTPEEIINIGYNLSPNWAKRIGYRYGFAMRNQDFKPRSL